MLTSSQVNCLAKHFDFFDQKVLVVGRLSSRAFETLSLQNAHVNHLNPNVVIYWGLFPGSNAETHLEFAARKCAYIILESEILDTSQSLCTKTSSKMKPSAAYIESMLRRLGFKSEIILDGGLNKEGAVYDWPVMETWECKRNMRRAWVAKRVSTDDPISFS